MDAGPNDDIDAMQQLTCKQAEQAVQAQSRRTRHRGGRKDTKGANSESKPLNVQS